MAIIRTESPIVNIKVYRSVSDMIAAAAAGDLTRVYIVVGGVFIDPTTYNEKYEIELFQDSASVFHGLYRPA